MMIHTALPLLVSLILILTPTPVAYTEETNLELAMALIEVDGSDKALDKVAELIVLQHKEVLRSQHPNINPHALEKYSMYLLEELLEQKSDLLNTVAALYPQFFTTEDMQQLLEFYETPLGRKLVKAQSRIQEKIVPLTFEWGSSAVQRASARVHQRLQAEGVTL